MRVPADLVGFSRGMFSNWLWHRPLQLVIDAGEGLQLGLGSRVHAPTFLVITHGHSDHVLGLPGFVAARRFAKGAPDKPLTIVHPEHSRGVAAARAWLEASFPGVAFPITWIAVAPGASVPLARDRYLECFAVEHTAGEPALGYRVVEVRQRLRPEFTGVPQAELERRARAGQRDAMMEAVRHIVFAHSGDAMPVPADAVRGADLLVHDATFLDARDRREPIHATTEEALGVAATSGARVLVLQHLSIRYDRASVVATLRDQAAASGFTGPVWLLDDGAWCEVARGPALPPTAHLC